MIRMTCTILIFLFSIQFLQAQVITGRIKDEGSNFLKDATVILKKTQDSAIVKMSLSDKLGYYTLTDMPAGSYFIQVSHTSYTQVLSEIILVKDSRRIVNPDIILTKAAKSLKEVVVTAQKPLVEVRADKVILNVEGTVNAIGQNALELLRKSPGVTVDQDGTLTLSGKNGVQIFIDGNPTPLSDKDLTDYLRSIQSTGIKAIEIISNPSAKYEAAGNAGIVNIQLKKNKLFGTNVSLSAGYNIGELPKYNAGFNFNRRNRHTNIYGNYNYNNGDYVVNSSQFRKLADTVFDQSTKTRILIDRHNFKAGMDYTINARSTLGLMINGNLANNVLNMNSANNIATVGGTSKILVAENNSLLKRNNINANINYMYSDTLGHVFNMDADYGVYNIRSNQLQPNNYFDESGDVLLYKRIYNMISPTDIFVYSFKTDYEQNWLKGRLGIGGKSSIVKSINIFCLYNIFTSGPEQDSLYNNDFTYRENINAAYLNYNRTFKGLVIQSGIRIENTNISGTSTGFRLKDNQYLVYDSTFHKHYTDFFPSGAITFNKNPKKQWTVSYSYRIDRPAYRDLNPFEFKVDDYTSRKGNTELRPQYTHSIGLSFLYNQQLTSAINYSHINNVASILTDTTDRSRTFITKKNMAYQDVISLNISYPLQYKWYSLFTNINTYYTRYKANFGPGRTIDLNAYVVNINIDQSFSLGKGLTGQLTAYYASPAIIQGTYKMKERWSIDAGLQKAVLKKMGLLSISVSDVFNTLRVKARSSFAGQELESYNKEESRQLKINFSYRFGNNKVKAARQRRMGVEDENRRTMN